MAILDNKLKKDYEHKKGIVISKTRIDTGSNIYRGPFYLEENLPKVNSLSVVKNINADKTNTTVWYKENFKESVSDSMSGTTNSITCFIANPVPPINYYYMYCVSFNRLFWECIWNYPNYYWYCASAYCNYGYSFNYTTYTYNITNNCGGYVS